MTKSASGQRNRGRAVLALTGLALLMASVAVLSLNIPFRRTAGDVAAPSAERHPSGRKTRGRGSSIFPRLLVASAAAVSVMLGVHGTALAVPSIAFQPSPSSTTCGSAQNITLSVFDTGGAPAPNNTNVTFTTSLGYINTPVATTGNLAIASLVIPPKMSGAATVTATALGVSERKAITVTCEERPPVPLLLPAPAALAPAAVPPAVASVLPPSAPATQAVSVTEYSYAPAAFNVRAGQPVSLNVINVGRLAHTFTIAGVTDSGSIAAGSSRSVQFTVAAPGTLTFFCTIHGANVMSGRITVTP